MRHRQSERHLNFNSSTHIQNESSKVWHEHESTDNSKYHLSQSMIMKMPGERHFMGKRLEIVCLFQAVEIERLTESLLKYRGKQKQSEAIQYNMKSYEIQVSELNAVISRMKQEEDVLKEKYDICLNDLQNCLNQNKNLGKELSGQELKYTQLKRTSQRSIEELKEKYELSYSREFNNLSIMNSKNQIEMRKLNDSVFILEQKKDQYEDKLALVAQELERLRLINQNSKLFHENSTRKFQNEQQELRNVIERQRKTYVEMKNNLSHKDSTLQALNEKLQYSHHHLQEHQVKIKQLETLLERERTLLERERTQRHQGNHALNQKIAEIQELITINQKIAKEKNQLIIEKENLQAFVRKANAERQHFKSTKERDHLNSSEELQKLTTINQKLFKQMHELSAEKENLQTLMRKLNVQKQNIKSQLVREVNEVKETSQRVIQQKNNQIHYWKDQSNKVTHSQTTILENTRKEQEKIDHLLQDKNHQINRLNQESTLAIHQLQQHIHQLEQHIQKLQLSKTTLIQQKQTLFQEFNQNQAILKSTGLKIEQILEGKENQIQNLTQKYEAANNTLRHQSEKMRVDGEKLRVENEELRVMNHEKQKNLLLKSEKISELQKRVIDLIDELERISSLVQEKDQAIAHQALNVNELVFRNETTQGQMFALQKEQPHFSQFITEIERLNQVVLSKDTQVQKQTHQIQSISMKINSLSTEQVKIIHMIESLLSSDEDKENHLDHQLGSLRSYLTDLHQKTHQGLADILSNSQGISRYLITMENHQIHQLAAKNLEKEKQEIYHKIIEISRQNANIRKQIIEITNKYQRELQLKQTNYEELQSTIQFYKKQIISFEQIKIEKIQLLHQNQIVKQELQNQIHENAKMKKKFVLVEETIEEKSRDLSDFNQNIFRNNEEFFKRYKSEIKKLKDQNAKLKKQQERNHYDEKDKKLKLLENQIYRFQKIIEMRDEQGKLNKNSFDKLQERFIKNEKELLLAQQRSEEMQSVLKKEQEENSNLKLKNHELIIELKQSSMLQGKIKVLNGQIDRLSYKNMDLCEQISSCRFALGEESSLERQSSEQLTLIFLLFVEIQSLRNRLEGKENELTQSRKINLSHYRP